MSEIKTLRVCLSNELPLEADRDPKYIYFLYDKLSIFIGKVLYTDPYAIVEDIPEFPVYNMLYFCTKDGKVKSYIEYNVVELAKIESEDQIKLLKLPGTISLVDHNKRYFDANRRLITLPYRDGKWDLTVSPNKGLKIDKDTVIGFNEESGIFEIIGKRQDFDLVFTKGYRGKDTKSVKTDVTDHSVSGNLKVSPSYHNSLRMLNDGLYANHLNEDDISSELKDFAKYYEAYKENVEKCIDEFKDILDKVDKSVDIVGFEAIEAKIKEELQKINPEIQSILSNYNSIANRFEGVEDRVKKYADERYKEIYEKLSLADNNPWGCFDPEAPNPPVVEPELPDDKDEELIQKENERVDKIRLDMNEVRDYLIYSLWGNIDGKDDDVTEDKEDDEE